MARRTKRPRVVWLPNNNAFAIADGFDGETVYSTVQHDVVSQPDPGEFVTTVHPVTIDFPHNQNQADISLADLESSGYRLRRIVGKVWCAVEPAVDLLQPQTVVCTAAYIVLRVDGIGAPLELPGFVGPNLNDNQDSPWIWRRSWILGQGFGGGVPSTGFNIVQSNNGFNAGSAVDGPHVDARTARIVGKDLRLFLVLSTTALSAGVDQSPIGVRWVWEQRCLGSMRASLGNRRNASR